MEFCEIIQEAIDEKLANELWKELVPIVEKFHQKNIKTPENNPLFLYCDTKKDRTYNYFGESIYGISFPSSLVTLVKKAQNNLIPHLNECDCAFLNLYRNQKDYIPWHRDKTHKDNHIFSFSLYENTEEVRNLEILCDETKKKFIIPMTHRSVIIMKPGMQTKYQHCVPKEEKKILDKRLSITLRFAPKKFSDQQT